MEKSAENNEHTYRTTRFSIQYKVILTYFLNIVFASSDLVSGA